MIPTISVLMPVFNAEKYLKSAIDSILNQSFTHYEFIIIDDGSSDSSKKIIEDFIDARIKIYDNEENLGLVKTLNKGIELCQGKYIARMDADDIAHKDRLKIQYQYMEAHAETGVCGSWLKTIEKKSCKWRYPVKDAEIKPELLFSSPVAHPSVIIRKSILAEMNPVYNDNYKHIEDYKLWADLSAITDFFNIPKYLLRYRIHDTQIGKKYSDIQKKDIYSIQNSLLARLGLEYTSIHEKAVRLENIDSMDLASMEKYLQDIKEKNAEIKIFDDKALANILSSHWISCCFNSKVSFHHKISVMLNSNLFKINVLLRKIMRKITN